MSQVVKTFTGFIMMMFLMLTAVSMLGMYTETVSAQNLHSAMIDELENSNYAKTVMEDCFTVADSNNYQLEIHLYSTEMGKVSCKNKSELPQVVKGVYMAEVVVEYALRSPLFYLNEQQIVAGYAR